LYKGSKLFFFLLIVVSIAVGCRSSHALGEAIHYTHTNQRIWKMWHQHLKMHQ